MTDHLPSKDLSAPPAPSPRVRWLHKHGGEVVGIFVEYVPTGVDTATTVWRVTLSDGHYESVDQTELAGLLNFYPNVDVPGWRAIACLRKELREQCEARDKWEKANNRELAEYKRLKAKFEGTS